MNISRPEPVIYIQSYLQLQYSDQFNKSHGDSLIG